MTYGSTDDYDDCKWSPRSGFRTQAEASALKAKRQERLKALKVSHSSKSS